MEDHLHLSFVSYILVDTCTRSVLTETPSRTEDHDHGCRSLAARYR